MNLYQCEVEYPYIPLTPDEKFTIEKASELIVAEHPDEARVLFYDLHLHALLERQIPPDNVEVVKLEGYEMEGPKGRYHGVPSAAPSAL